MARSCPKALGSYLVLLNDADARQEPESSQSNSQFDQTSVSKREAARGAWLAGKRQALNGESRDLTQQQHETWADHGSRRDNELNG